MSTGKDEVWKSNDGRPYRSLLPFIALFGGIDALGCIRLHWYIDPYGLKIVLSFVAVFVSPLLIPRYRQDQKINAVCSSVAAFIFFSHTSTILSYLIVSTNAPLVDAPLARLDSLLGFNWLNFWIWQRHHATINHVLSIAYASPVFQSFVAIVYLGLSKQEDRLIEFFRILGVALIVTLIIAGLFPAAGAAKYFNHDHLINLSSWSDFEVLRAGDPMSINLLRMQGLVSFPSFHSIMAVALAYAMRKSKVFPLFLIANILVLISTPVGGGHYLVDVFGGILTVALSIRLTRFWRGVELLRWRNTNA